MIPPLPVELLSHILDLATSPSDTVSIRIRDRKLLHSCCRVSRQFCAVAQPMLWGRFVAKKQKHVASLFELSQLAQHIRNLEFDESTNLDSFRKTLQKIPALLELRIEGRALLKTKLRLFTNLTHLALRDVRTAGFSGIVLHHLLSLSIENVQFIRRKEDVGLPAASLSNLRALATAQWDSQVVVPVFLVPAGLPHGQLEILQVCGYGTFPLDLQKRVTVAVYSLDVASLAYSTRRIADFEQIHIEMTSFRGRDGVLKLQKYLEKRRTTLSISLASTLAPSFSLSPALSAARDALLETCRSRSIDIILLPRGWTQADNNGGVSKDYWEYAKELKRKKAVEAAGVRT